MDVQDFNYYYPDYPVPSDLISIQPYAVNDDEVPSGTGDINREGYTYGELRHQPIINELLEAIEHSKIKEMAAACNRRNAKEGFHMFKVDEEYCFWGLRVGPMVPLPSAEEMKSILLCSKKEAIIEAVINKTVTQRMIRDVTYDLLRKNLAVNCDLSLKEAKEVIGNVLDCTPHEDQSSGLIFMVPNWAHRWFHHDGYVKHTLRILNHKTEGEEEF